MWASQFSEKPFPALVLKGRGFKPRRKVAPNEYRLQPLGCVVGGDMSFSAAALSRGILGLNVGSPWDNRSIPS
jgi:hypothetical protein